MQVNRHTINPDRNMQSPTGIVIGHDNTNKAIASAIASFFVSHLNFLFNK